MTFETLARQIHNDRIKELHDRYNMRHLLGEDIYTDFCLWCNCVDSKEWKKNAIMFGKWLKENNITLTEYQRRWIAENHFGWQFTWNSEKNEWESKKI